MSRNISVVIELLSGATTDIFGKFTIPIFDARSDGPLGAHILPHHAGILVFEDMTVIHEGMLRRLDVARFRTGARRLPAPHRMEDAALDRGGAFGSVPACCWV
jgi:hypothetical protein